MKLIPVFTLIFFISTSIFAQKNDFSEIIVGFNCGISADDQTKLVYEITELINEKIYIEIASWLNSKNSGKIYLSIIVLERLYDLELYELSEKQISLITFYKSLSIPVMNCFGCFIETNFMKEIFQQENFIGSKDWLEKTIKSK